jgi:hypothetical protein
MQRRRHRGGQGEHGGLALRGPGACCFRFVSASAEPFDVSFSHPNADISRLPATLNGRMLESTAARRPAPAPSSLYLTVLRNGNAVVIGTLPEGLRAAPA